MKMTREDKMKIWDARRKFDKTLEAYGKNDKATTSDHIVRSADHLKQLLWEHRDDIITILMVSQDIPP